MNDFISTNDFTINDIVNYFKLCSFFKLQKRGFVLSALKNKTLATVFYENSTRTKTSFTLAGQKLGARVIDLAKNQSSIEKGESFKDTLQTLQALEVDAFIIRHFEDNVYKQVLPFINIPIINGGDGANQHPSQALYDAFTMYEHFTNSSNKVLTNELLLNVFNDKKIAIVGDLSHSRVVNSNFDVLTTLGAKVLFCSPKSLQTPYEVSFWSEKIDDILALNPDVVMMLRVQKERMVESEIPNDETYFEKFGLTDDRLKKLKKGAIILHPGPVNRGVEISDKATDSKQSRILTQVHNALFMRMAVIYKVFFQNKFPWEQKA